MKAMIFAAGLGSRLRPITSTIPKALVEVGGKTLLQQSIEKLRNEGISEIIINVHHFPDQIIHYIKTENFTIPIHISDERDKLLDTGGGLKKASDFFDNEAFLIYNVDILSTINLSSLIDYHNRHKPLATLVVRKRNTKRYLMFDEEHLLCGWTNMESGEKIISRESGLKNLCAFSGIHVVEPRIFDLMPDSDTFSMIDLYLEVSKTNKVLAFIDKDSEWMDVGKIEQIKKLNQR